LVRPAALYRFGALWPRRFKRVLTGGELPLAAIAAAATGLLCLFLSETKFAKHEN
jgi:hypothetical protein